MRGVTVAIYLFHVVATGFFEYYLGSVNVSYSESRIQCQGTEGGLEGLLPVFLL